MDLNAIKNYLENLEKVHERTFKNDTKYSEECKKNKANKKDYKIEQGHIIEEYFNKYQKKLQKGKLVAFKENELWLMNKDTKYWEINNESEFRYFEVPSKNIAAPLFIPKVVVIGLIGATLAFAGLFTWKMLSGDKEPTYKLNINCEHCDYTVLGDKTSFKAHEVAYITLTDPDEYYLLPEDANRPFMNVSGDVEDSRRFYDESKVLAVEFNDQDISIDALAMPTFTTYTLEAKSSYDPLEIGYLFSGSNNEIKIDWGDGVIDTRTAYDDTTNKTITGTPKSNTVKIYGDQVNTIREASAVAALNGADQIIGIDFGYYITNISDSSFQNLTNLQSVNLGNGITNIGFNPFKDCTSLTGDLFLGKNIAMWAAASTFNNTKIKNIYAYLTNLTAFTYGVPGVFFQEMPDLEYVYFECGTGLSFGTSPMIKNCSSLKKVHMKLSTQNANSIYSMFDNTPVEELILEAGPNDDSTLELSANGPIIVNTDFTSLKKVKLKNVITLGTEKFISYKAIEEIEGLENVRSLGANVFNNNKSIKKLTFGKNLNTLPTSAFMGSTLEHVVFKGTIAQINSDVFKDCTNLKIIDLSHTSFPPSVSGGNPFGSTHLDNIEKIIVANEVAVTSFSAASYWSDYASVITTY